MIISQYDPTTLHSAFGITMSDIDGLGVGAGWGRVRAGTSSEDHQHDEPETFVIVRGSGAVIVDGRRTAVGPGTVVQFEPFETHVVTTSGPEDLVFATFYWRAPARAAESAARPDRRRFRDRPVFVFSTPPTPNGDLHLGHLSGPYLGADVFVRFQRMLGVRAWHLTGSDDHQSYVVAGAEQEGRTPAETAARYSQEIAETLRLLDVEVDQYTVTQGDADYADGLRDFFSRLVGSGGVTAASGPALFDSVSGDYLYEVDVTGACPGCGGPTGGNICEECGEPNVCTDLTDSTSRRSAAAPTTSDIVRFVLPLNTFRPVVDAHHQLGRVPARIRELSARVLGGPDRTIPMSHPATWGVTPREPEVNGQVIWVWPEMAYSFLHGIQLLGRRLGTAWSASAPEPDWKIVHFFGYDNTFYHSVLYPVLYGLSHPGWKPDIDYHVNEFLLLDGQKFSTSRRHAIWGKEILTPDTVDGVRFYLSRIRSETGRTDFQFSQYASFVQETLIGTWQAWLTDLGRRVTSDYGGLAPDAGTWTPEQTGFLNRLGQRLAALTGSLNADQFSLNLATQELQGLVEDTIRFSRSERRAAGLDIWRDQTRTAVALELAAARLLANGTAPLMPRFSRRLAASIGLPEATIWPRSVELVPYGSPIELQEQVFFAQPLRAKAALPEPMPTADFGDLLNDVRS